jgi:hypothetical protein
MGETCGNEFLTTKDSCKAGKHLAMPYFNTAKRFDAAHFIKGGQVQIVDLYIFVNR